MDDLRNYPIAVIQDRYGGSYSGGDWIAISKADEPTETGESRVDMLLSRGPHGDDCDAMEFWSDPPDWVAVGNSPDAAIAALMRHHAKEI